MTALPARHPYLVAVVLALAFGALAVIVAAAAGLPVRDPDGAVGPAYVRLAGLVAVLFCADVLPRVAARVRRGEGRPIGALRAVVGERWTLRRAWVVLAGLLSFYVTYLAYRNLKSFLPFVRDPVYDGSLAEMDQALGLGVDPATVLHDVLGTGIAAHVLSLVYLAFLILMPLSLVAALVWTRDLRRGFWYVTALGLNWILGTASYYLLPALGPVFADPATFAALPPTGVSELQATLWAERLAVLADPFSTQAVHGVAAFGSLHVSIAFTAAAFASLIDLPRWACRAAWAFFGLTTVATIYLGWHYVADDVAGVAIGALAVWAGAAATGHDVRATLAARRPARRAQSAARVA
ncbi:MAG TPA: phosphatase PAP2 family protein [Solirubrobacteraceae bacterium]|nr:phosphatase PAP2 family protein [Solirubrobacteraceae bacterium]